MSEISSEEEKEEFEVVIESTTPTLWGVCAISMSLEDFHVTSLITFS